MEKVFKILSSVLLMFLIVYSIRAREGKFRNMPSPTASDTPPATDEPEASPLSYSIRDSHTRPCYRLPVPLRYRWRLTILRQGSLKELQRLAVPPEAYYFSIDPVKDEIHLHHEGEIYIYARAPHA